MQLTTATAYYAVDAEAQHGPVRRHEDTNCGHTQDPGIGSLHSRTGLLGEPRGGVWHVFSGRGIDVEHEKKVDLGVLGGADCHGLVRKAPFSTVDGL